MGKFCYAGLRHPINGGWLCGTRVRLGSDEFRFGLLYKLGLFMLIWAGPGLRRLPSNLRCKEVGPCVEI